MRRKFALSLAAVALIFLLAAWYLWGSRRAPQGQPPLLSLTELKNQLHGATPHCCENSGILWDMVALYPAGVRWTDGAPTFFDGPVWKISLELSKRLSDQP